MADEQDDYLWTGAGAGSLEVRALERELRPLAWTPRELPLASPVGAPPPTPEPWIQAAQTVPARRNPRVSAGWSPFVAGLAAAAAVLVAVVWLRGSGGVGHDTPGTQLERVGDQAPAPGVAPAAGPPNPQSGSEWVDPFARDPRPSTDERRVPTLEDPFSGDSAPSGHAAAPATLVDPFAGAPPNTEKPAAKREPSKSAPNLKDPFSGNGGHDTPPPPKPGKPAKLVDPFAGGGASTGASEPRAPNLKDPFQR
jgi:hypothetical protein